MGKAKKDTNVYVTSDQLYNEWLVWRQTGEVTPKLGEYMLLISQGVMKTRSFNRYSPDIRDDMIQEGVLKQVKNLHNLKPEKRQFFFAYLTRCVFTAAITYLSHYYKDLNTKRELILETMEKIQNEGDITGQSQTPQFKQLMEDLRRMLVANTKTEEYDEKLDSCEKI